jgi:hypothetical protein
MAFGPVVKTRVAVAVLSLVLGSGLHAQLTVTVSGLMHDLRIWSTAQFVMEPGIWPEASVSQTEHWGREDLPPTEGSGLWVWTLPRGATVHVVPRDELDRGDLIDPTDRAPAGTAPCHLPLPPGTYQIALTWHGTNGKPFPYEEQDLLALGWGGERDDLVVWWLETECRADTPNYLCVARRAAKLEVPSEKRFTVDQEKVANLMGGIHSVKPEQVVPSLEILGCATVVADGLCRTFRMVSPNELRCHERGVPSSDEIGSRTCNIAGKEPLVHVRLPLAR